MKHSKTMQYLVATGILMTNPPAIFAEDCDPVETYKLLATDGAEGNQFGQSVAVSGATALVGARNSSAYLFDTTTGQQQFKILADGGWFGWAVAIDGTTALVGAPFHNSTGSAYLFDTTTGQQSALLSSSDGAADDNFGYSVAISGNTAIIGVPYDDDNGNRSGSAYLFDTNTGQQLFKLLPDDGAAEDFFGWSVAISGANAIVGAINDADNGSQAGSAYLFDIATGQQIAKLLPRDGASGDFFGHSVALSGTTAIVGAPYDDYRGMDSGSAYLFDTTTGDQLTKLAPSDGAAEDFFGWSVSISGNYAISGAKGDDDNGWAAGSAYLFDVNTGDQIDKLLPDDGAAEDYFGNSVAISGNKAIVGANGDDDQGAWSGSGYLFNLNCPGADCLDLTIDNLIAGQRATFTITNGTPGKRAVTVYGTNAGQTAVNNVAGYCATFGIKGVNQNKIIGGLNRTFDVNGEVAFGLNVPGGLSGLGVFFQSAQKGTCPDECMSNLVDAVVQ